MKSVLALCFAFALLAGGCAANHEYVQITEVTKGKNFVRSVTSSGAREGIEVNTEGNDTVITWLPTNRRIVIAGITGYKGRISTHEAKLDVGELGVVLDAHRLVVTSPDDKEVLSHAALIAHPDEEIVIHETNGRLALSYRHPASASASANEGSATAN